MPKACRARSPRQNPVALRGAAENIPVYSDLAGDIRMGVTMQGWRGLRRLVQGQHDDLDAAIIEILGQCGGNPPIPNLVIESLNLHVAMLLEDLDISSPTTMHRGQGKIGN